MDLLAVRLFPVLSGSYYVFQLELPPSAPRGPGHSQGMGPDAPMTALNMCISGNPHKEKAPAWYPIFWIRIAQLASSRAEI